MDTVTHSTARTADDFLQQMILSASGWRAIFSSEGIEDSTQTTIPQGAHELIPVISQAFILFLKKDSPSILLARDSRPTGTAIATSMKHAFQDCGARVLDAGVVCFPEVLSAAEELDVTGIAYITASHNPLGYNGFKFALKDAVLAPEEEKELRDILKTCMLHLKNPCMINVPDRKSLHADDSLRTIISGAYKQRMLETVAMSTDQATQKQFVTTLKQNLKEYPLGIVIDMNGSARSNSIDASLLKELGADVHILNGHIGQVVHGIIPEGRNLEYLRQALEELYRQDSRWLLGYMPDNDGDRGNFVFIGRDGNAHILSAQEGFALAVLSELAADYHTPGKKAVAVNCATSLRIKKLCSLFDVHVATAEVGEARVTACADSLRDQGYHVRIFGEGSNGGTIVAPSRVRDPLNTVLSFLRLLRYRNSLAPQYGEGSSPADIVGYLCGMTIPPYAGLQDFLVVLPPFYTTESSAPEALLPADIDDLNRFKSAYENEFMLDWDIKRPSWLQETPLCRWQEEQSSGSSVQHGMGETFRNAPYTGGLKIILTDAHGEELAFMWMRPSGTEPVFRISVDCSEKAGGATTYKKLLAWHQELIERAFKTVKHAGQQL